MREKMVMTGCLLILNALLGGIGVICFFGGTTKHFINLSNSKNMDLYVSFKTQQSFRPHPHSLN